MTFPPEIIELIQAGFGVMFLVAIITFVWIAGKAMRPFTTMTEFIRQNQEHLQDSQNNIKTLVDQNAAALRQISTDIERLVDRVIAGNTFTSTKLDEILQKQAEFTETELIGVVVLNTELCTELYSSSALNLLGWDVEDFPTKSDPMSPPVLNVMGDKVTKELWPAAKALEIGKPVRNIPLQIFSMHDKNYKWFLVSAYPCDVCETGTKQSKWITVIFRKLEELGRM